MNPRVSIITPTYNHARYLPQCVESVLVQSFPDWEHIIVDDGSTDDSLSVLSKYADARIRVITQAHAGLEGLAETYQRAFSLCRGEFVGLLDGDDYYSPDQLEVLLPAFNDARTVVSYGKTRLVGAVPPNEILTIPSEEFVTKFPQAALVNDPIGQGTRAMLRPDGLTFAYPVSLLLRRAAVDRIGGLRSFPGLPLVDYPTLLYLTLEGRFHYVDRLLGRWRVHEHSTTRNHQDLITLGIYTLVQHFRRAEGHRVDITPAEWDEIDRCWSECRRGIARRLSRRGDYHEARRLFVDVARAPGTLKQRSIAWLGALAAVCRREPSYKAECAVGWLMRPWSRGYSGPDAGRQ